MKKQQKKLHYREVFTAATLSGICGLSYEILFTRVLSIYFGSIFYVAVAVIAGFLFGIGVASFIAHRYVKYLPYVEIAIGLFAFLSMFGFRLAGASPLYLTAHLANYPFWLTVIPGTLILLPGLLIGMSLPMFAIVMRYTWTQNAGGGTGVKDDSDAFTWIYLFYNIGGALCVLTVELVLVKWLGISATGMLIACVNFLVGFWMLFRMPKPSRAFIRKEKANTSPLPKRDMLALFFAGLASGIFQIMFLEIASHLWGSTAMTMAGTLASALAGAALGAMLIRRYRIRLSQWNALGCLIIATFFAVITPIIYLWANIAEPIYDYLGADVGWIVQGIFVVLVGLPVFTIFGGTEPSALLERIGTVFESGKALGISAIANALGAVAMVTLIHPFVGNEITFVILTVMMYVAAMLASDRPKKMKSKRPLFQSSVR